MAKDFGIKAEGFDKVLELCNQIPQKAVGNAMRRGFRKLGKICADEAKRRMQAQGFRNRTGRLYGDIKASELAELGGSLGNAGRFRIGGLRLAKDGQLAAKIEAPFYAYFLEKGWLAKNGKHIAARPFLEPAAEHLVKLVPDVLYPILTAELSKEVDKAK